MDNAPRVQFISFTFVAGFGVGAFIGVVLAMFAVLLAWPEEEPATVVEVPVFTTATPPASDRPQVQVRTTAAMAVRVGPGESFATLGTISRGDAIEVVGRDFDSKWLAIRFPAGSNSRGWIPAAQVEGLNSESLTALAVLLPTPIPLVFHTPSPFSRGSIDVDNDGAVDFATPGPRPTTSDLAVTNIRVLNDGRISVTVINRGPADINDQLIMVTVRALGLQGESMSFAGDLDAGDTVTLRTEGFRLSETTEIQVIADPSSNINDPNRSNNVDTVRLVPPTPTPPPTATPEGFG